MKGLEPTLARANAKEMTTKGKEICILRTSAHPFEGGKDYRVEEGRKKREEKIGNWTQG